MYPVSPFTRQPSCQVQSLESTVAEDYLLCGQPMLSPGQSSSIRTFYEVEHKQALITILLSHCGLHWVFLPLIKVTPQELEG